MGDSQTSVGWWRSFLLSMSRFPRTVTEHLWGRAEAMRTLAGDRRLWEWIVMSRNPSLLSFVVVAANCGLSKSSQGQIGQLETNGDLSQPRLSLVRSDRWRPVMQITSADR